MRMPQPEHREALPDHPVPAGLAAPAAWRLRGDGLGAQPLEVSRRAVAALAAQTHTADGVCEDGWMVPDQPWEGVAVAAIRRRSRATIRTFAHSGCRRRDGARPCGGGADGRGLRGTPSHGTPRIRDHGAPLRLVAPGRPCCSSVTWVDRLDRVAEETPTTGETLARTRVPRRAGRTSPRSDDVVQRSIGHAQGAPALAPGLVAPAWPGMPVWRWWLSKERKDDEHDHRADSR